MPKMTSWTRRGFLRAILASLFAKKVPKVLPYKQTGSFYTYRYEYVFSNGDTHAITWSSQDSSILPGQMIKITLPDCAMPPGVVSRRIYRA